MKLQITLKKSPIGAIWDQRRTVTALGLTKLNKTVVKPDNDAIRGMIFKVKHMVEVVEIQD
jgi:large subunit ribosomal protein L30